MLRKFAFASLVIFLSLACANTAMSSNLNKDVKALDEPTKGQTLFIPYGFFNQNTGAAAAGVFAATGYLQPQMTMLVNVFAGSNKSSNLFFATVDTQVPWFERVFVDSQWMFAEWGEIESYQVGNPKFLNEIAGNNDSNEDNFIEAEGSDNHYRIKFKYLLPLGDAQDEVIHTFAVNNGLLVAGYEAGGSEWNPLTSGRTTLSLEPFYRHQDFEDEFGSAFESTTSGVQFGIEYDNTDWYKNPSRGSRQSLKVSRDWGADDDSSSWTAIEFEYSKYIPLPFNPETTRQRVLAFNLWISDVPTWNSSHTDDKTGAEVFHRAPGFAGSTLGGLDRQRGYATNRFHDRSAINYALEYRNRPVKNPFPFIPLIKKLHIPWWQWIAFVEMGRVADEWDVRELHSNMKYSVGVGARISVFGLIIRMDGAVTEEGGALQMFFNHVF